MDSFSDAYTRAKDVTATNHYSADWEKFLRVDTNVLKVLKGADGPDAAAAGDLEKLRVRISGLARKTSNGDVLYGAPDNTVAAAINTSAAALKFLKHLYFAHKRGGQDVWVFSPPKAYTQWMFDEITGDKRTVTAKLNKEAEIYSNNDRGMMCAALQLALKWSQQTSVALAKKDRHAKAMVKRWFADEDTTDAMIGTAINTLNEGFKKISVACNSSKLVFSDEPCDRANGGWKDWAFVYKTEKMDVVYIQGAFIKSGRGILGTSSKLWKCALTIIHELSHRKVGTVDNAYDYDGLKPSKGVLTHAAALNNADTWAYFALDIVGALSASERKSVLF